VIAVAAGQANDAPALLPLLAQLRVARPVGRPRTRPDRLRGDKAYSSRAIRAHLRERGIVAVIPQPSDQIGHRLRRGSRGGRPPGFDAADYRNRNVIERRFGHLKQWRGLATRYFPAEALGGVTTLRAISAPFPDARWIPTGGINATNVPGGRRRPWSGGRRVAGGWTPANPADGVLTTRCSGRE
jgi:transposase